MFTSTGAVDSVHLTAWPEPDAGLVDSELAEQMELVRRLVELGRGPGRGRCENRQPLARALSSAPGWVGLPEALRDEVRAELNVEALTQLSDADELVEVAVRPNYRALGRRFGKQTQQMADAIRAVHVAAFVAAYRTGTASVSLDGSEVPIGGDEVVVSETPRSGWAVASTGSDTVALDLELSHELRLAGLLREIIRLVQDGRTNGGLEVSDRIELWWRIGGSPDTAGEPHPPGPLRRRGAGHERAQGEPGFKTRVQVSDTELGLQVWARKA